MMVRYGPGEGGACAGLQVIELGQGMAGSMPGMLLADNGADVIKVEPPWGDWSRHEPGGRMWNRGKRSVVLDLRRQDHQELGARLAAGADVLIESFRPGTADRLGMGWDRLRQLNPRLVYCSISGFGPATAYQDLPGYEGIVAAVSGHMVGLDVLSGAVPSQGRRAPIFTAVPLASFAAAQLATQGVLAALLARSSSGCGDRVSTSLVQGLAAILMRQEMARGRPETAQAATPALNAGIELCFMTAECADGRYVQMCARQDAHFRAWLGALGLEGRLDEPRYRGAPLGVARVEDLERLDIEIRGRMRMRTRDEWMRVFTEEVDVGADPFLTPDEFLAHPQMLANDRVVRIDDPEVGPCVQVGALASLSLTPSRISGPAPRLGADTQSVLAELGETMAEPAPPDPAATAAEPSTGVTSAGATAAGAGSSAAGRRSPLDGVTVLEVAYFLAGPLAATLLAEMGARVIKVEPLDGDPCRRTGLQSAKLLHGKESIALDLKSPAGRAVLLELADRADVFLHSFRPGVVERLGIDADVLCGRNPGLVYVHAASYGSRGPQAGRAAFHSTPNALVGSGILQAGEGNPPVDDSYPDPGSALGVASSILVALLARQRTGLGQRVETTMLATTGYVMSPYLVRYPGAAEWRLPDRGQHGTHALQRLYACGDGWIFIGCSRERDWPTVAAALEMDQWCQDERFGDAEARRRHDEVLTSAIQEVVVLHGADHWARRARAAGAPLVEVTMIAKDAWLEAQGLLIEAEHPIYGAYWRPPVKVGFERMASRLAPVAAAGEHTRALLAEIGYPAETVDGLLADGVVGVWEPAAPMTGEPAHRVPDRLMAGASSSEAQSKERING